MKFLQPVDKYSLFNGEVILFDKNSQEINEVMEKIFEFLLIKKVSNIEINRFPEISSSCNFITIYFLSDKNSGLNIEYPIELLCDRLRSLGN